MNNPFGRQNERIESRDDIKLDNDFFYLAGASETGHLWINPEHGNYRIEFELKDDNWLRNSIQPRIEDKIGRNYSIKQNNDGYYQYKGNSKDLVTKMADYKNNPDKISKLSLENQTEWLRGYMDAKLTVDAKGFSQPTSIIRDGDMEKLNLARDILAKNDISSELKSPETKNPYIKITGKGNHQKIRDNINPERPSVNDKLDNLLSHPERFEKTDSSDYVQARRECGDEFHKLMGDIVPIIRPKAESYEFKNPVETGSKIKPDNVVKHPNGKVEAIEIKLHYGRFVQKDKDYLKHSEIDEMTLYLLEGDKRENERHYGKEVQIKTKEDLLKELKGAKKDAKTQGEKEQIDKLTSDVNNLGQKASSLKSAKNDSGFDVIKAPSTLTEQPGNPEKEDEGGDGKEVKNTGPKEPQEGDHYDFSDTEKKVFKK